MQDSMKNLELHSKDPRNRSKRRTSSRHGRPPGLARPSRRHGARATVSASFVDAYFDSMAANISKKRKVR